MEEVDHIARRKKKMRGHRNRLLVLLCIIGILGGLHFWLVRNAETILENLVKNQSKGRYHLLVKKVHLSYDLHTLTLVAPQLIELNKSETNEKLKFRARNVYMKLHSVADLFFNKQFVVDSMSCSSPYLQILAANLANIDTSISITEQITKTYQQIQNLLNTLQVKKLKIQNGSFEISPERDTTGIPTIINKINLHIFNFKIDSTQLIDVNRNFLSDDVEFNCGPQTILLHNGQQSFSFSNFHLSTKDSTCSIDSASFTSEIPGQTAAYYDITARHVLLKKGNLKRLYYHKTFQVDSLFVNNAHVFVKLLFDKKNSPANNITIPKHQLGKVLLRIADKAVIGYISVPNTSVTVTAVSHGKSATLNVLKQSLTVKNLVLNANTKKIYSMQKAVLSLHNYSFKTADSSLNMQLASIGFDNDTLQLNNLTLFHQSAHLGRTMLWHVNHINLQHLLLDELIINQRLVANAAILYHPVINVQQQLINPNSKNHQKVSTTLANIDKRIAVSKATIINGYITVVQPGFSTKMNEVNGNIDLQTMMSFKQDALLSSNNSMMNIGQWEIHAPPVNIIMNDVLLDGNTSHMQAGKTTIQAPNTNIILEGLQTDSLNLHISNRHLEDVKADNMLWEKGKININLNKKDISRKNNRHPEHIFYIGRLNGKNTTLQISDTPFRFHTDLTLIKGDDININRGKFSSAALVAKGNNMLIKTPSTQLSAGAYMLQDKKLSTLDSVHISRQFPLMSLHAFIPAISWITPLQGWLGKIHHINMLDIEQPVIHLQALKNNNPITHTTASPFSSLIDSLHVSQANIDISSLDSLAIAGKFISSLQGNNINIATGKKMLSLQSSSLSGNIQTLALANIIPHGIFTSHNISWNTRNLQIRSTNSKLLTSGEILSIGLNNSNYHAPGIAVENISGKMENIILPHSISDDPLSLITASPNLSLHHINFNYHSAYTLSAFKGLSYNHKTNSLQIDSTAISPANDLQTFSQNAKWQKDYIKFSSGAIAARQFDINDLLNNDAINAKQVTVNDAAIFVYRDKTLPLKKNIIKPMPVNVLGDFSFSTQVDTAIMNNSRVSYTEVSPRTNKAGTVTFSGLQADIRNISDNNQHVPDSIYIDAKARLMDTPLVALHFAESYRDSLNGFSLTAGTGPFDLTILNPVLSSLYGADVISGKVHKFNLQATGNNELAYGQTNFLYSDLKFHLNNNIDSSGKKLYTGLENFIANLIAFDNNNHRKGIAFYQRDSTKSFFNYWLKIVTSGVTSSVVGKRINRKYHREYKKWLKRNKKVYTPTHYF